MGRHKTGWYERNEVAKITPNWVQLNIKITEREKKLLHLVHNRKLIRRDHLEFIHEDYRNIGKGRTSALNRSIKKLFDKMCLDKVHEPTGYAEGNKPSVLSLDRAGAIILNVPFRPRIKQIKRMVNSNIKIFRQLPSNYPHIHGINKLEVDTITTCLKMKWEIIRWDLEHDNKKVFILQDHNILIPDIFLLIKANDRPHLFFIEYDTGNENYRYSTSFPILLEKIEKYKKYKLSGAWKNEWWAKKLRTPFPKILFITEDEKRIDYIIEKGTSRGLLVLAGLSKKYKDILIASIMDSQ